MNAELKKIVDELDIAVRVLYNPPEMWSEDDTRSGVAERINRAIAALRSDASAVAGQAAVKPIKFLKNEREWKRLIKYEGNIQPQDMNGKHTGGMPREFPCYAYLTVQSYGYEEQNIHYLYMEDLIQMESLLLKYR